MLNYQEKNASILQKISELEKEKEELEKSRFMKNRSKNTVIDQLTNLEWYVHPDKDVTFDEACKLTESLGKGWRMPTVSELQSLYQPGIGTRNIDPMFQTTGWWVWSIEKDGSSAFNVSFSSGNEVSNDRRYSNNTRVFGVRPRS